MPGSASSRWRPIDLKKLARLGSKERRRMIDTGHPKLSVAKQCELLSLPARPIITGASRRRQPIWR